MTNPCDLCGETDSLDTPGDPSGKIRICKGCGFVHVKERRSLAEVAAAWTDIYRSGGYDPEWPGVKARLFYVAEWLDQTIGLRGKSVLDIGAGNGQFLDYARYRIYNGYVQQVLDAGGTYSDARIDLTWALEPDEKNVEKLLASTCGHRVIQGWASDEMPAPEQKFDIITLNWTLENTADCLAVLRYAKRCLAPGGHVVVSTGSRILVPFKKPLSSYLPQNPNYPHDTHCFRWTISSLQRAGRAVKLGIRDVNDWPDRDEMIVTLQDFPYEAVWGGDEVLDVIKFFGDWGKCFP